MPNDNMPTEEEFEENIKALREVRPWDLLNPSQKRVDPEEKKRRMLICRSCEFFREKSQTCQKCGCFMNLKTVLAKAYCPEHKW